MMTPKEALYVADAVAFATEEWHSDGEVPEDLYKFAVHCQEGTEAGRDLAVSIKKESVSIRKENRELAEVITEHQDQRERDRVEALKLAMGAKKADG